MAGFNQMLGQIKGKAENLTARIVETSSQEKDGATIKGLKQRKAELVQEKRLNQAIYLLEHTAMSVMEIGMSVGYDNISYFHRIFQKRYGMTPRKYRISRRN